MGEQYYFVLPPRIHFSMLTTPLSTYSPLFRVTRKIQNRKSTVNPLLRSLHTAQCFSGRILKRILEGNRSHVKSITFAHYMPQFCLIYYFLDQGSIFSDFRKYRHWVPCSLSLLSVAPVSPWPADFGFPNATKNRSSVCKDL